ncbi:organic cation/carnitine transporter 7-like [Leguminivora glycinivorella]|uniref:organic cation/carnitine transporter 7-like n=1 Tax=Leguminivora glycinivorella TaxID=1035111 RepID=UPI00200F8889|nr:organic cation/carnitine transporter 7-like [Leguminivora glycinivorella]
MTTFEEAYELTGYGKYNILALFTNGFILLYATVECLSLGYVLNTADCDLKITIGQRGAISAATFIGVVVPAMFWGYVGDKYGRRTTMLPATVLAVIFSIGSSLSTNFLSMFLLRMITGTMVSASCATAYVYLGELNPPSRSAAAIAWGSAFIAGAYFVMPLFAWMLLPLKFSFGSGGLRIVPWRVLMWASTIWGILACVGMALLPESPAYVLGTKGGPEALAVLAKFYSWNQKKPPAEYPITEIVSPPIHSPKLKESLARIKYMIKPPLLRCVLISHICNFMVFMQSNAFYVWLPHIVDELLKHGPSRPGASLCRIMNDIHSAVNKNKLCVDVRGGPPVFPALRGFIPLVMDECIPVSMEKAMYPIAIVVGAITANIYAGIGFGMRRGWAKAKMYCMIMGTCALFIVAAALVPNYIAGIILFVPGVCGIASNTVLAAAVIDVIPTCLRALSMCTLFMIGRLGAAVGSHTLAWGLEHNCVVIVLLITVLTTVTGSLLFLWPDTQKTREEMKAQNFNY